MDYNNTSVSTDGYNWLIKFDVLVNFCVLIDSLVILSFSESGATNHSFYSFILSLCGSELLVVSSLSKSFFGFP